jgi:hypothetical protein
LDKIMIVPASAITPPVGEKSPEWVKKLTPTILTNDQFKTFASK